MNSIRCSALVFCFIALGQTAFAMPPAETEVQVTSFYYTNRQPDRTAEICGVVTGPAASADAKVALTIDPGNHAATYVTVTDNNGQWCALVNSLTGVAKAVAITRTGASAGVTAQVQSRR